MKRQPKQLLRLQNTPFVRDGNCSDLMKAALDCFTRNDMRGYSKALWEVCRAGKVVCDRVNARAAEEFRNGVTELDLQRADHYDTLTGNARKRYGHRYSDSLTRAGVRFGASLPAPGAKIVWGF